MEPSLAPQCLLVFYYLGLLDWGSFGWGHTWPVLCGAGSHGERWSAFRSRNIVYDEPLGLTGPPLASFTWELAKLGLTAGDATVCTSGPVGNLCARRVFALVT